MKNSQLEASMSLHNVKDLSVKLRVKPDLKVDNLETSLVKKVEESINEEPHPAGVWFGAYD